MEISATDLLLGLADNAGGYKSAYFTDPVQAGIEKVRIEFILAKGIGKAQGRSLDHSIGDSARTAQNGPQAQALYEQKF
jgi:hypothetical protein